MTSLRRQYDRHRERKCPACCPAPVRTTLDTLTPSQKKIVDDGRRLRDAASNKGFGDMLYNGHRGGTILGDKPTKRILALGESDSFAFKNLYTNKGVYVQWNERGEHPWEHGDILITLESVYGRMTYKGRIEYVSRPHANAPDRDQRQGTLGIAFILGYVKDADAENASFLHIPKGDHYQLTLNNTDEIRIQRRSKGGDLYPTARKPFSKNKNRPNCK